MITKDHHTSQTFEKLFQNNKGKKRGKYGGAGKVDEKKRGGGGEEVGR